MSKDFIIFFKRKGIKKKAFSFILQSVSASSLKEHLQTGTWSKATKPYFPLNLPPPLVKNFVFLATSGVVVFLLLQRFPDFISPPKSGQVWKC